MTITTHTAVASASMHGIVSAAAKEADGTSWLALTDNTGATLNVFVPIEAARAMALGWERALAGMDDVPAFIRRADVA